MVSEKKSGVDKIIERSGNGFHSRVVSLLRESGWVVLVSPYYSDNFTDKPREIDIIAEKRFDVSNFIDGWLGTVNVRLFIECKYINGDTVFWFDAKDKARAVERILRDTGLEDSKINQDADKHHYFADVPVAKLFSSEKSSNEDNEVISKAINQNLNATVYYRNRTDLKLAVPPRGYIDKVLKYISYPLIVVSSFDRFFSTNMGGDGKIVGIEEPFQLEVNYAYLDRERNGHSEFFLIDVLSLDKLIEFLSAAIEKGDIPLVSNKVACDEGARRSAAQRSQNSGIEDYT